MNVDIEARTIGVLTHATYSCRSFKVRTLTGNNVPRRVWWATTATREAFVECCATDTSTTATVVDGNEERVVSVDNTPASARRVAISTDDGRAVWRDETDDRWMSHSRPEYTVMAVGSASPPLVELRPRHVTSETASSIMEALRSEREKEE